MHSYSSSLNWIDTQEKVLLSHVKKWASINTYTYNVEGLAQLLDVLMIDFQRLGGVATRIKLSSYQDHSLGEALKIRKRPEAPIQVLLGGHYDTVFSQTSSFQNVEESKPGILKGPGVADMKGGLAILLTAVEALERSPFAQEIGWEILLTPDEEIGSPRSDELYMQSAKHHQFGLLFEPSFADGAFASERKGSLNLTVIARGRAAHVGRDFHEGRNAVMALAHFIHHLDQLQQSDCTMNVADLHGQGPLNIVPAHASCRINVRSMNADTLHSISDKMKQIAEETKQEGIHLSIEQDSFRPPKPFDQKTESLFHTYEKCAAELNLPFSYRSTGGVCDGNLLAAAGLPTLDTAGVIGGGLHTHEEYLLTSSLVERAKLAALFLFKLATRGTCHV